MDERISAGLRFTVSVLCYVVGAPLLTYFISPGGLAGVLLAYPLYTVTWFWGRRLGFLTAGLGMVMNTAIWILLGQGHEAVSSPGRYSLAVLFCGEGLALALFVMIVSGMKRREDENRREIIRSRDLLRLSEARYRSLIDAAPECISVVEGGKVVFCNPRLPEMLGFSRAEMIGMDMARLIHGEDVEAAMARHADCAAGRQTAKSVLRGTRKDGSTVWIESAGIPIEWAGRPAVLYFAADVSERVHAEEALRQIEAELRISESKYRNLIEVAPEAISVIENGRVIFCNTQGLAMLGYTEEEMIGMEFTRLLHEDSVDESVSRYWSRTQNEDVSQSTVALVRKNGEVIWVKSVGKLITWEGRPALLTFTSDITETRRLEEKFAQAQKMEAVGRLAGGVAHDFNNMLQVVLGAASMARSSLQDTNALLGHLGIIEEAGRKSAALTQQLLAFSRKQIVQPKVLDVRDSVLQAKKMLGRVLGEDVTLAVETCGEEGCVRADAGQLQQIIMNLALNARDAMPAGGKITISVGTVSLRETLADEVPPGEYVRLAVKDTGRGMDGETMGHLFEPFFTTKERGKGTGLGLSIIYGIVTQSGGHILVESRPGTGTAFTIYLPRLFAPSDRGRDKPVEESTGGSGYILLVEDDAAVRGLVRKMLEQRGYSITEASSGEEAMEICSAATRDFEVLITDIGLAGMRGGQVAERARRYFPRMGVIFMTGYVESGNLPRQDGAIILPKPFSASELLLNVDKAFRESRAAHPIAQEAGWPPSAGGRT